MSGELFGATITRIEVLPREPGLVRLRSGRRTVGTVRAEDLQRLGIAVGGGLGGAMQREVERITAELAAQQRAVRLLARRPLSSGELERRLIAAGHGRAAIAGALDRLRAARILDDAGSATDAVRARSKRRPASRDAVREDLARRGFDDATAGKALAELGGESDLDRARRAGRTRLGKLGSGETGRRRRLGAFLARRGFDEETCDTVVRELLGD